MGSSHLSFIKVQILGWLFCIGHIWISVCWYCIFTSNIIPLHLMTLRYHSILDWYNWIPPRLPHHWIHICAPINTLSEEARTALGLAYRIDVSPRATHQHFASPNSPIINCLLKPWQQMLARFQHHINLESKIIIANSRIFVCIYC